MSGGTVEGVVLPCGVTKGDKPNPPDAYRNERRFIFILCLLVSPPLVVALRLETIRLQTEE